jgi:16S rRNA processing protein RimM
LINDKELLRIAVINSPHSLNGKLKISVITDIIERLSVGNSIYIETKNGLEKFKVQDLIYQKGKTYLLTIQGINDRTEAEKLKGCEIFIERVTAEKTRNLLGNDEFYLSILLAAAYI